MSATPENRMPASHTPGPWEIAQYENFRGYSIWAKGAGCIAERWYPSDKEDAPILANARLISAAPELLEKLKELMDVCDGNYRELTDECRAVIAKAEALNV